MLFKSTHPRVVLLSSQFRQSPANTLIFSMYVLFMYHLFVPRYKQPPILKMLFFWENELLRNVLKIFSRLKLWEHCHPGVRSKSSSSGVNKIQSKFVKEAPPRTKVRSSFTFDLKSHVWFICTSLQMTSTLLYPVSLLIINLVGQLTNKWQPLILI